MINDNINIKTVICVISYSAEHAYVSLFSFYHSRRFAEHKTYLSTFIINTVPSIDLCAY